MIPKIVHLCWLSGDPFPELIARCQESWKQHLPNYEIMLWNQAALGRASVPWVDEATSLNKYAFAADYIRLHALFTHGGIYLDADVEVFRSFDELLGLPSFIGYETGGDLEPAVIGAEPGAEWIGKCLAHYSGRHFVRPDGSLDLCPLPLIVGEALRSRYRLPAAPVEGRLFLEDARLMLFDASYFSPKNAHTGVTSRVPHTFATHHFDGQWVDKNWLHRVKTRAHRLLLKSLGASTHRKIVEAIRRIR